MCYIITHTLEFNSWRGFDEMVEFVKKYYGDALPIIRIKVPLSIAWHGWRNLDILVERVNEYRPEDLNEMSIYGEITIVVQKSYTAHPDERATRKIPINPEVERAVGTSVEAHRDGDTFVMSSDKAIENFEDLMDFQYGDAKLSEAAFKRLKEISKK